MLVFKYQVPITVCLSIYCVYPNDPPPHTYTIFTFQNNTCTQHVSMHNCKSTPSENDLVKNLSFISGNTVNLMCTHCKFQEHNTTIKV